MSDSDLYRILAADMAGALPDEASAAPAHGQAGPMDPAEVNRILDDPAAWERVLSDRSRSADVIICLVRLLAARTDASAKSEELVAAAIRLAATSACSRAEALDLLGTAGGWIRDRALLDRLAAAAARLGPEGDEVRRILGERT